MTKQKDLIRTNLYLARRVWGLLKTRAFEERTTTSSLIDYLVRRYFTDGSVDGEITLHRRHNETEERKPRAVYFDPALWTQLQERSKAENFSIASLVESLLIDYLYPKDHPEIVQPEDLDPSRYIRVGNNIYDLGEHPIFIDSQGNQTASKNKGEGK